MALSLRTLTKYERCSLLAPFSRRVRREAEYYYVIYGRQALYIIRYSEQNAMMGLRVGQYKLESSIPRTLPFAHLPSPVTT